MANQLKKQKPVKCKICGKKYVNKQALIDHIGKIHSTTIPEGWSPARYENFLRTGKTEGHCVYCKTKTGWNESTGKYNRMCGSEKCRKTARELANKNYIGKNGKPYSINDPEQQKKMVYARKNSGTYVFEDEDTGKKYKAMYDSSYGKDFLEMVDMFLNWNGADITAPSPHTYYYEYEGKKHFYIPDVYIHSLNLEVELKDGGDNPNKHPKIQSVDKVKEKLKDEVMDSLKNQVNYIKICNKDYTEFFALLSRLKDLDECPLPPWERRLESTMESITELDETIDPLMESSSSKKKLSLVKRYALLEDPTLNYDNLLLYYRKKLFHEKLSKQEWIGLYNELTNVQLHLQKTINSDSENDRRMNYEAKKALKEVRGFLHYMKEMGSSVQESSECLMESKSNKIPIYIVSYNYKSMFGDAVKVHTKSQFNHSSLSLDPSLTRMYTFARNAKHGEVQGTNGFAIEPLSEMIVRDKNCIIKVDAVYVSPTSYKKLQTGIQYYIDHSADTNFNYLNIARIAFGIKVDDVDMNPDSLNCSVFTDRVLKSAGINVTGKANNNLVSPKDLSEADAHNKNVVTVYYGKAVDYDASKIEKITFESTIPIPESISSINQEIGDLVDKGEISDGSHTFQELYNTRNLLYIALLRIVKQFGKYVWYSDTDSEGGYDGYFLLGMNVEQGKQISFHLEDKYLPYVKQFADYKETPPVWDGHTTVDVNERLLSNSIMESVIINGKRRGENIAYPEGDPRRYPSEETPKDLEARVKLQLHHEREDDEDERELNVTTTKDTGTIVSKGDLAEYGKYADLDSAREPVEESTMDDIWNQLQNENISKYASVGDQLTKSALDDDYSTWLLNKDGILDMESTDVSEATSIDAIKDDTHYYPVFVFLSYTDTGMAKLIKSFTHDPYSRSSISFDTNLNHMLSFNRDGFVEEDVLDKFFKDRSSVVSYSLYMYLATQEEYQSMKAFVDQLTGKKDHLKYNILGLTNFIFGKGSSREDKYFCSEFVASVISAGNGNIFDRQPYMISPYYFAKNKNFVFIKKGLLKNYSAKDADRIVAKKLKEGGFEDVHIQ